MNDEDAKKFWKQMERLQKLTKNDKVHGQHNDGFKTSKLTNITSDGQYVNEITFPDWSKYRWVKDNMEQLRKDLFTFDQLKLPDFSVSYDISFNIVFLLNCISYDFSVVFSVGSMFNCSKNSAEWQHF